MLPTKIKPGDMLSPLTPDPFEYFTCVQREKSWWQRVCMALLLSHAFLTLALVASALRPPQVIVKDRIAGAAPFLHQSGTVPPITVQDARAFFMQMIELRYGWDSRSLPRDLKSYLGQCLQPQRARESAFFETQVSQTDGRRVSRLRHMMDRGTQNKVVFATDLEEVQCVLKEGVWHCMARVDLIESPLDPSLNTEAASLRTSRLISASLLQVRHTVATPSGLIVGAMKDFAEPKRSES